MVKPLVSAMNAWTWYMRPFLSFSSSFFSSRFRQSNTVIELAGWEHAYMHTHTHSVKPESRRENNDNN